MDSYIKLEKKTDSHLRADRKSSASKTSEVQAKPHFTSQQSSEAAIVNLENVNVEDFTNWRDLSDDTLEDLLRVKWDLNPKFGPFAGIGRMKRWERAQRYGLHPPETVREIILSGRVNAGSIRSGYF